MNFDPDILILEAKPAHIDQLAAVHYAAWHKAYQGVLPDDFVAATDLTYFQKFWQNHFANAGADKNSGNQAYFAWHLGAQKMVGVLRFGPADLTDPKRAPHLTSFVSDKGGTKPPTSQLGELYQVYLLPGARHKGLGSRLFLFTARKLHQMGFTKMLVEVDVGNQVAGGFYSKQDMYPLGIVQQEDQRADQTFVNPTMLLCQPDLACYIKSHAPDMSQFLFCAARRAGLLTDAHLRA